MRKNLLCLLLSLSLTAGLTGCGSSGEAERTDITKAEESRESINKKGSGIDSIADREEKREVRTEGFGSVKAEYEDFTYLEAYEVKDFPGGYVVYVPDAENAFEFNTDHQIMASGSGKGVTLLIMIIPDIQPGDPSYERLSMPIEDLIMDYSQTSMDFLVAMDDEAAEYEMSEVEKYGEDKATMTITHFEMDDGKPAPFFQCIDLFREDNSIITVAVQIDSELTTDHTEDLLAEIEEYLEITVGYDEEALLAKYDGDMIGQENNNETQSDDPTYPQTVSTGFWEFTLPAGWKKAPQYDSDYYVYSPKGRENDDTLVSIMDLGEGDLGFLSGMDLEELEHALNADTTDEEVDISDFRIIEDGNLGYALTYSLHTNLSDDTSYARVYLIEDRNHVYMLMGMGDEDNLQGGEVADHNFETAKKVNK